MNYNVTIEDGVMKAKIAERSFSLIWMHRKPRGRPVESKPGLYILVDDRGYCCYVGETKNFKERMARHESEDKFCWWKHSIFFWDAALAHAIAEANGKPSTAGGIHQKLTNFWAPGRGRYSKANSETRTMLESYGIVFDREGFVKSCANVPFPLRRQ